MNLNEVQAHLAAQHIYLDDVDGRYGKNTHTAIEAFFNQQKIVGWKGWSRERRAIAAQQLLCRLLGIEVGAIDGRMGEQTRYAFSVYDARKALSKAPVAEVELWRDTLAAQAQATPTRALPDAITSSKVNAPSRKPDWPKQNAMNAFYGPVGTGTVSMILPFSMRIAWETSKKVNKVTVHKKVKENLERIWERTLDHYGYDELKRLGLDLFGGCLNVRKMRGGSAMSIHSWAAAWDVDPDHNQLKWKRSQAALDNPPYDPFWRFVYDEGATSLGRERDYDWMHFQFADL